MCGATSQKPAATATTATLPSAIAQTSDTRDAAQFEVRDKATRLKLWELPHVLHCPVIGTCLDVNDLRRIARNSRCQAEGPLNDYEVHVSFVVAVEEKNALALATHKFLDKKFAATVRRFGKARSRDDLEGLWTDAIARGQVPGALWALLTHAKTDTRLRRRAYEDVHMLSHQIGAGQRADLMRLVEVERELKTLQQEFDAQHSRTRRQLEDRDRHIVDLEKQLRHRAVELQRTRNDSEDLTLRLADAEQRLSRERVVALEKQCAELQQLLLLAEQDAERWHEAMESASRRAASLEQQCNDQQAECAVLEGLLAQTMSPCQSCEKDDCRNCPDLNGRRVLCVGGRNQLINHYRELVDRCNGRFEHYDGGVEDNRQRLDSLLAASDAVVCATDSVSHDAYYRLKRFCKKQNKPYVFLRTSGISTFARALERVSS